MCTWKASSRNGTRSRAVFERVWIVRYPHGSILVGLVRAGAGRALIHIPHRGTRETHHGSKTSGTFALRLTPRDADLVVPVWDVVFGNLPHYRHASSTFRHLIFHTPLFLSPCSVVNARARKKNVQTYRVKNGVRYLKFCQAHRSGLYEPRATQVSNYDAQKLDFALNQCSRSSNQTSSSQIREI